MADTPLTLAETASVFGEMLTFQSLLKSAPDTNDLPPAPRSTTTRTSGSAAKSSRITGMACCISRLMALCRSGLLKVIHPMPSAFSASIFVVSSCIGSSLPVVRR